MPTKTSRESVAKPLAVEADNFTPHAARETTDTLMNNLRKWGELAQNQAQAMQAVASDSVAALSGVNAPKATLQDVRINAEIVIALTAKHLQEVAGLSMGQFKAGADLMQMRRPADDAFSDAVQAMRVAASTMESATISMLNGGISAQVPTPR